MNFTTLKLSKAFYVNNFFLIRFLEFFFQKLKEKFKHLIIKNKSWKIVIICWTTKKTHKIFVPKTLGKKKPFGYKVVYHLDIV